MPARQIAGSVAMDIPDYNMKRTESDTEMMKGDKFAFKRAASIDSDYQMKFNKN